MIFRALLWYALLKGAWAGLKRREAEIGMDWRGAAWMLERLAPGYEPWTATWRYRAPS